MLCAQYGQQHAKVSGSERNCLNEFCVFAKLALQVSVSCGSRLGVATEEFIIVQRCHVPALYGDEQRLQNYQLLQASYLPVTGITIKSSAVCPSPLLKNVTA